MEEHELASDVEPEATDTLKLTARGRSVHTSGRRHRRSRDETEEEIQEDDEATLRELLIRYLSNTSPAVLLHHACYNTTTCQPTLKSLLRF